MTGSSEIVPDRLPATPAFTPGNVPALSDSSLRALRERRRRPRGAAAGAGGSAKGSESRMVRQLSYPRCHCVSNYSAPRGSTNTPARAAVAILCSTARRSTNLAKSPR